MFKDTDGARELTWCTAYMLDFRITSQTFFELLMAENDFASHQLLEDKDLRGTLIFLTLYHHPQLIYVLRNDLVIFSPTTAVLITRAWTGASAVVKC